MDKIQLLKLVPTSNLVSMDTVMTKPSQSESVSLTGRTRVNQPSMQNVPESLADKLAKCNETNSVDIFVKYMKENYTDKEILEGYKEYLAEESQNVLEDLRVDDLDD